MRALRPFRSTKIALGLQIRGGEEKLRLQCSLFRLLKEKILWYCMVDDADLRDAMCDSSNEIFLSNAAEVQ